MKKNIYYTEYTNSQINKSITIEELIDMVFLQRFQDYFTFSSGVGALFFNKEMKPITKPSNFKSICKDFFRVCTLSKQNCKKSDQALMDLLIATKKPTISKCKNGLIDFGAPIILNNEVIGFLIAGQVFMEPPDIDWFKSYAQKIGADEDTFMKSLLDVPVFSKEKILNILQLLALSAEKFSEVGYQYLIQKSTNEKLENEIINRKKTEQLLNKLTKDLEYLVEQRTFELKETNKQLEESIEKLKKSQNYFIQTQKMASLGSLVVGLSHELNTPLGVAITSQTYIYDLINSLRSDYENHQLTHSKFTEFLNASSESSRILNKNLMKCVHLIDNLKQIAFDQNEYPCRKFLVKTYFENIVTTLTSDLKDRQLDIQIDCEDDLELNSYPGIWSQIIMNLVQNSVIHGFRNEKDENDKKIQICCYDNESYIILTYKDNGMGMTFEQVGKAFDPFYTTTFGSGNNGLGLFAVYNLVTKKLNGTITLSSNRNQGVSFIINIPKTSC